MNGVTCEPESPVDVDGGIFDKVKGIKVQSLDFKKKILEPKSTYIRIIHHVLHVAGVKIKVTCIPGGRGGGHLGIFWVGVCRPGLQIGTPF